MPILFLVFILVGCGSIDDKQKSNIKQKKHDIDLSQTDLPKLKMIKTYDHEVELAMEFPRSQLGVCLTREINQILLKDTFTEKADFLTLKWVLYHELGHCVLGLEHSKNQDSLMFYRTPYLSLSNEMIDDAIDVMFLEYKNKPAEEIKPIAIQVR